MKRLILAAWLCLASIAASASDCIPSGVTDQYTYFVAVDATDFTSRETGLATWTVYRSRNGGAAAAFTTPTINETDQTNMPGTYELLLDEDMTIDSGDDVQHMVVHITHAGMAPVTKEFCIARAKITAGNTLTVASDGDLTEVNTLTGHTVQTGDSYARLGAPAGASHAADIAAVKSDTAATLTDTADMQPKLGTFSDLGSGATLAGNLEDMRDDGTATYSRTTDSLQAIRDQGDAAWITGGGGSCTADGGCIADGTAQGVTATSIQLASAETFADNELVCATVLIASATTGAGQARQITAYTGTTAPADTATVDTWTTTPTGTITYRVFSTPCGSSALPLPGNVVQVSGDATAADNLEAASDGTGYNLGGGSMVATSVTGAVGSVTGAVGSVTGNVGGNVTGSVGSVLGGINTTAGTITTLDALDAAQDTQHGTTQTAIDALPTAAENATEALSQQRVLTGTCDSGSTTTCVDDALTQANESQLDDRLICFSDSWCALITGFTPASDTVTTTKTAPSTRASLGYTIFPATTQ